MNQELCKSETCGERLAYAAPTELTIRRTTEAINISSLRDSSRSMLRRRSSFQRSVSRMQVIDRKKNHATPLASAICWKCYKAKVCDTMRGDLHKFLHRLCGKA